VDAVTVQEELRRNGALADIGGAPFLHTLVASVPTAANATYYARIVKEAGVLRRLIDVGTQIVQLGFETPQDTERAVDIAESLVYQVAQGRVTEATTGARMTIGEFVRRGRAGEDLRLHTLGGDWRLHTVRPSAFLDNGVKPVLRLTTRSGRTIRATGNHPFRTLEGWVPLAELHRGARIAVPRRLECAPTASELPDELVALTAYLIGDGSLTGGTPRLTACDPAVRADASAWAGRAGVHAVEVAFRRRRLDDCADEACHQRPDEDFHRHTTALSFAADRGRPNPLTQHLAAMGLMGVGSAGKHIPAAYFRLPDRQVRLFLSRLYATDGWASIARYRRRSPSRRASVKAEIGYCSISQELARGVQHLLLRLGLCAFLRRRKVTYQGEVRWAWHVVMSHTYQVERFCREIGIFSKERQVQAVLDAIGVRAGIANTDTVPRAAWRLVLEEKGVLPWAEVSARCGLPRNHDWHVGKEDIGRERLLRLAKALDSERLRQLADSEVLWDEVLRVEPDGVDQVYDLTIDGSHNFVANDIVVHNSTMGLDIARHAAVRAGVPTVVFSLEMSKTELVQRLMCAECTVDMQRLRTGRMEESDWTRLTRSLGKLADAPLFIDDSPGTTMMEIRAKCRRLKQRHGLGLVVVDYLQLMQPSRRFENRQQEVSEISRSLKLLAKELDVPVMAISQLSRQPEARSDRRPMLSDLRESGALEQDSDVVLFIYRDELYDPESARKGEADFILAKHRNGPTDTVTVTFQGQYSRFAPMAARSL
ncbi:MAG TPA: DnaB-like helicase C-terminal domain-containing protein, partial [Actinomycetes bacterium]|nr:DnaB-like helicase C-terminal domain-containing protein [Actinomycetes bacterium]